MIFGLISTVLKVLFWICTGGPNPPHNDVGASR